MLRRDRTPVNAAVRPKQATGTSPDGSIILLLDRWGIPVLDTPHRAVIVVVLTWAVAPLWFKSAAAAQPSVVKTEVSGTAFRITLSDGSMKQGTSLAGAVLVFTIDGKPVRVRIAAITPDRNDKALLLHDLRVDGTDTSLCRPDPDGKQLGFPLAGRTAPDGRFVEADPGVFELVCTSGAQGKCVRFGYRPWESAPDGGPMRAYFDACVRMLRADYCGDGHGWTRDGTIIDFWDDHGIQKTEAMSNPALSFEAGWSPEGAICVAHTRVSENITRGSLLRPYPHFGNVTLNGDPSGYSWYHSMQSRIERRMTSGWTVQASYTWSKAMEAK